MSKQYVPEQPVFGPGRGETNSARHIKRYVRTYRVLQQLAGLEFASCLDVGAAEGYTASLVGRLLGAEVVASDARPAALAFARQRYGLSVASIDAHRLPFRPKSFDVVISTETVEHLPHPVEAMLEMLRVARKAVIVSTCEATPSPALAWISKKLADYEDLGGHINFFTGREFRSILGETTCLSNQFIKPGLSRKASRALRYRGADPAMIKSSVRLITWTPGFVPGCRGIVARRLLDSTPARSNPRLSDGEILDAVLDHVVPEAPQSQGEDDTNGPPKGLDSLLECPRCGTETEIEKLLSGCPGCAHRYGIENGVPVLTPPAEPPTRGTFDRERYLETIQRAGLILERLERTKAQLERRSGISHPLGRAVLRTGRRGVQTFEGMRRTVRFLASRTDETVDQTTR